MHRRRKSTAGLLARYGELVVRKRRQHQAQGQRATASIPVCKALLDELPRQRHRHPEGAHRRRHPEDLRPIPGHGGVAGVDLANPAMEVKPPHGGVAQYNGRIWAKTDGRRS